MTTNKTILSTTYLVVEHCNHHVPSKHSQVICASTDLNHARTVAFDRATEDMCLRGGTCVSDVHDDAYREEGQDIMYQYTAGGTAGNSCSSYLVLRKK